MTIYIGSDYAGYKLKEAIKKYLELRGLPFFDVGSKSDKAINDFPAFARPVAKHVSSNKNDRGILICGTGIGMCIAANRFKKVRAVLAFNLQQARWARTYDNANILCLSSWSVNNAQAKAIVRTWLDTPFKKLVRRVRRFKTIDSWRT
ncbi:RpiB/LacA/LacB family sugar-phosphate isomerase [Patescibacteria group bacterium]|nr:RpiB/LacA/LacB family sugar-phosphate isomerase [Patescibacteria group bacterium]MBU0964186.1 RpiB/LacA/LacB family sugar-phosphate isomerase [Patescibacteria group bacterium]